MVQSSATAFIKNLSMGLRPDDRLLVGMDLKKDPEVLEQAYDDSSGVGRRFNENILVRVNEELGANFDLAGFRSGSLNEALAPSGTSKR